MERELQIQKNQATVETGQMQGQVVHGQTGSSAISVQLTLPEREEVADLCHFQHFEKSKKESVL